MWKESCKNEQKHQGVSAKAREWKICQYLPSQLKCRLSSVYIVIIYIRGGITIHCKISIFFVRVRECGFFKFVKSARSNINKFIQWQYVNALLSKVGNNAKGSNWVIKHQTVEFWNDICTAPISQYYYYWTDIPCTHFSVEWLLNSGVSN